jgi:hypothetical protein
MRSASLPDLVLRFSATGGSWFRMVAEPRNAETQHFAGEVEDLRQVRKGLKERLYLFKSQVERAAGPDGEVQFGCDLDDAFATLHAENLQLLSALTGADEAGLQNLAAILRRILTDRPAAAPPPFVQVIAPRELWAPIELLTYEAVHENITDGMELERACRRFLGLAAIVQRLIAQPDGLPCLGLAGDPELHANPGLPVSLLHDATLAGAQAERRTLAALAPRLTLHGPWPSMAQTDDEVLHALIAQMRDPALGPSGPVPKTPIQILHFACHCDTRDEKPGEHAIRLGAEKPVSSLTVTQIRNGITAATTRPDAGPPVKHRSLVFLNACSSSVMDYHAAPSFPHLFLRANHRGYIGTSTDVPDEFAARFAAVFYDALVTGSTLGKALHTARWHMIGERRDPLGILYTMYADPDMHVVNDQKDTS